MTVGGQSEAYARLGRNEHEADYLEQHGGGVVVETAEEGQSQGEGAGASFESPESRVSRAVSERDANVLLLYIAHFFGTFGDRMWQFAVPYLFTKLWMTDMVSQDIFCLFLYGGTFFGMFYAGNWMDATQRLPLVRTAVVLEGAALLCSIAFFYLLVSVGQSVESVDGKTDLTASPAVVFTFAVLLITTLLAEIMTRTSTMALERDWVIVIADGDQLYQAHLNSWMRRIDLVCKLCGPMLFIVLDHVLDPAEGSRTRIMNGLYVVAGWNIIAVPMQLWTLQKVYDAFPALAEKTCAVGERQNPVVVLKEGFSDYWKHDVRWASLAYGQLWFTVLDSGNLMTAFLVHEGISDYLNVATRGAGAIFGILGTFAFPHLVAHCSNVEQAGKVSITAFCVIVSCIGLGFIFLSIHTAAYTMCVGLVLSRMPLWSFDLSIQQILQQRVAEDQRGIINGVNTALCQIQMMTIYVVALLVARRYSEFVTLTLVSVLSVVLATYEYYHWTKTVPVWRPAQEMELDAVEDREEEEAQNS
ncbi:Solute carrier family 40 member 1 [Diplonema papillatum]|nr:Solute carrier family 40 member 1 [Diplonema papillatum]